MGQLALIKTERPTKLGEEFSNIVAERVAERLINSITNLASHINYKDEFIADCKEAIDSSLDKDGFELAKQFDDKGYGVDEDWVSELGCVWHIEYEVQKELMKKWVQENEIKPQFSIGQSVKFKHRSHSVLPQTGIIRKIHEDTAEYEIYCPQLGHLSDEDRANNKSGTTGIIKNYEDVEPIEIINN